MKNKLKSLLTRHTFIMLCVLVGIVLFNILSYMAVDYINKISVDDKANCDYMAINTIAHTDQAYYELNDRYNILSNNITIKTDIFMNMSDVEYKKGVLLHTTKGNSAHLKSNECVLSRNILSKYNLHLLDEIQLVSQGVVQNYIIVDTLPWMDGLDTTNNRNNPGVVLLGFNHSVNTAGCNYLLFGDNPYQIKDELLYFFDVNQDTHIPKSEDTIVSLTILLSLGAGGLCVYFVLLIYFDKRMKKVDKYRFCYNNGMSSGRVILSILMDFLLWYGLWMIAGGVIASAILCFVYGAIAWSWLAITVVLTIILAIAYGFMYGRR